MEEIKNRKVTVMRLIKVILFLTGFIGLSFLISYMLTPKRSTPESGISYPSARGFYGEPENTIDVVVLGNSGAYSGFSPMELWHNFGYASYVSCEGNQNLGESINIFEEILQKQKPKLLIIDVDCFWQSKNEIKRIETNVKSYIYRYFPMYKYHDRWKTVKLDEMFAKKQYNYRTSTKGQYLSRNVKVPSKEFVMEKTDKVEKVPRSSVAFMKILLNKCEENDIEVLLIDIPAMHTWNYEKHNGVEEFAKEYGLNFLDLSLVTDKKYAINWKKDSRDGGRHLNSFGARKCTKYIGEFIKDNYNLEDKRGDEAYASWDEDYKEYRKFMKKGRKKASK